MAKLCDVCSKLSLTHHIHPCRNPLPSCSTPPADRKHVALGSVDEIKRRRSTCDICRLVAENLDKDPSLDLDGECRIKEIAQVGTFKLPRHVKARDASITHFHLTQAFVIFDPPDANQLYGPLLPWESKESDTRHSQHVLRLQVRARSDAEATPLPAASLQTEEEFLATVGGRYVSMQTYIPLIRAWLHQCESTHGKDCMSPLQVSIMRNREPTLVVDVIDSCLVDTPRHCRYVALSYVWGTAPAFMHLVENSRDLRNINSLGSFPLPATIRDAITLVCAIGERYLWVDSLCIIQNDWKMKNTEITRMGSIYSGALFTIIAAAGDHANSGLPGVEPGTREQVQRILKLKDCELMTVIDIRNTPSGIEGTTWAQRAWTHQERVLSNRLLVFANNQVYWSCRAASHSEELALEEARDILLLEKPFPQTYTTDHLPLHPLQSSEYFTLYRELTHAYRQRRLTYQTDILNAFSGVSEIIAGLQNDRFLWGFPESLFSYAMTWSFVGDSARNHVTIPIECNGSKQMIPIPSWSWAAWSAEDPNYLPVLTAGYSTLVRPVIRFDLVDRNHQLVRIKEQSWPDHPGDRALALWENEQDPQLQSHPPLKVGQLRFWTSFANVRTVRSWGANGPGTVNYELFPPANFQPTPAPAHFRTELLDQDFIVVAKSLKPQYLILVAIEWKDGVAYRLGRTFVNEAAWDRVENRQWRLITLG